jgi:hypothetical protein
VQCNGTALKPSNPRGSGGQEGWSGDRHGAFHDWPAWRSQLGTAGFVERAGSTTTCAGLSSADTMTPLQRQSNGQGV